MWKFAPSAWRNVSDNELHDKRIEAVRAMMVPKPYTLNPEP